MKRVIFPLIIIAIIFAYLSGFPLSAQQLSKITVSPPRVELKVRPGQVYQKVIKIHNGGDSEMALKVKIQDFIVNDNRGTPLPVKAGRAKRWAASNWLQVSPMKFLLHPGETKTLDVAAVIPQNASPGGHYAVIFFQPVGNNGTNKTAAAVMPTVGSLFYLTVAGKINEQAFVVRMEAPRWQEYGPVKIVSEIENLSDIHIRPRGVIRVYNWWGQLSDKLSLTPKNIFPGSSRRFENRWPHHWGFGRYRATLTAVYGQHGGVLSATIFFWIIPWHLLLAVALLLIGLLAFFLYRRQQNRRPLPAPPKAKS